MDGRALGQPELTFDLSALTRSVVRGEPVVGDLRAETVDEKPGSSVEIGHCDTDVLDATRQGELRGCAGVVVAHALDRRPEPRIPHASDRLGGS